MYDYELSHVYIVYSIYMLFSFTKSYILVYVLNRCGKKRNCSKLSGHASKCDNKRVFENNFWQSSPAQVGHQLNHLHERANVLSELNDNKGTVCILQYITSYRFIALFVHSN